jgi:hypothetical protein
VPALAFWEGEEMVECVAVLSAVPGARVAATGRGLTASFSAEEPWRSDGPSLLEITAGLDRAGLGPGVRVRLTLPRSGSVEDALLLNEREVAPACPTDMLGGWSAQEGVLQHDAFFPNVVYAPGLVQRVALTGARRARWARGWPPRAIPAPADS